MKVHQQGSGVAADRSERSAQRERLGSDLGSQEFKARQIGMDRVEVSHVGETAAGLVGSSMHDRQARVAALSAQFQSGGFKVNLETLSQSILDHDIEPDISNAG